ncbi:hypothetical protein ACFQ21_10295 [Ohtaekwangia kribbensis]|jgi:hypothetical protein|uniref:Uncharacterized protein n=1 Tax=Ohtaekwangia kribbensis TaxID=688913 RepID=A0ABW3K0D1_9BACT
MTDAKGKGKGTEKDQEAKPFEENLESLQHEELSGLPDEDDNSLEYSDTDEDEDEGVGDGNVGRGLSDK